MQEGKAFLSQHLAEGGEQGKAYREQGLAYRERGRQCVLGSESVESKDMTIKSKLGLSLTTGSGPELEYSSMAAFPWRHR